MGFSMLGMKLVSPIVFQTLRERCREVADRKPHRSATMIQVQSEEMMSRNCRKHVRDQPNDTIVSSTPRDRIARSDDRRKGSNQETSPFQWPFLFVGVVVKVLC